MVNHRQLRYAKVNENTAVNVHQCFLGVSDSSFDHCFSFMTFGEVSMILQQLVSLVCFSCCTVMLAFHSHNSVYMYLHY